MASDANHRLRERTFQRFRFACFRTGDQLHPLHFSSFRDDFFHAMPRSGCFLRPAPIEAKASGAGSGPQKPSPILQQNILVVPSLLLIKRFFEMKKPRDLFGAFQCSDLLAFSNHSFKTTMIESLPAVYHAFFNDMSSTENHRSHRVSPRKEKRKNSASLGAVRQPSVEKEFSIDDC